MTTTTVRQSVLQPTVASGGNATFRVAFPVTLTLRTTHACWVLASNQAGQTLYTGTLQPSQQQQIQTAGALVVRVGNSSGLTLFVNNVPAALTGVIDGEAGDVAKAGLGQLAQYGHELVAVEQLVRDLAGGRLIRQFKGIGAEPLDADNRHKRIGQYAAYRRVWHIDRFVTTPVFARDRLSAGDAIRGPAIVEQYDTCTYLAPDWGLTVRDDLLVLDRATSDA